MSGFQCRRVEHRLADHPLDKHLALIQRAPNGTPNTGEHLECVSSMHASLLDFSQWWIKEYA
jgi:hypothetical protein